MSAPDIDDSDIALVNAVLRTPHLSMGPMVARFEAEWCARFGVRHAVAVSSGTAGLHLALLAAGVSDGDFVLTSSFSFVASANAALFERAIPIFVDIDPDTLAMSPEAAAEAIADLDRGGHAVRRWLPPGVSPDAARPIKVVLPVHVFGQPAELKGMLSTAARHGASLVEDACEAPGAVSDGAALGTSGDAGVFGFYPNKPMTTGEGGLVVTRHDHWAGVMRSLRNQGRDADGTWLRHVRLGYNYRLDEMSAALGLGQLRRLDTLIDDRARVAAAYRVRLETVPGITLPRVPPSATRMSWFVYVVRLDADLDRRAIIAALAAAGVPSKPYFPPIHLQPLYRDRFGYGGGELPVTEAVAARTLALPFHGRMTDDQIGYVADALTRAIARARRGARTVAVET